MVPALRHALSTRLTELAAAVREGRTPRVREGRDAFDGPLHSIAAVGDTALQKALAPLRLRLEWLGMIGHQLAMLTAPVEALAVSGGRR